MSRVRIPPVLRQATDGARELQIDGNTVGDVLDALYQAHPAVRGQLVTDDGELHRFVNLYVNDEDAKLLDWLDTPLGERDTLLILPAMAGGGVA
jgi:sulfur-carrier protein